MNFTNRSPLAVGAYIISVLAIIIVSILASALNSRHETEPQEEQPCTTSTITIVSSSTTLSTTTSTRTPTKTTNTTTTTSTTTVATTTVLESTAPTEPQTEPPAPEPVYEELALEPVYEEPAPVEPAATSGSPITDYEVILLRNVVAREYGSDWVSVPEKAKVVAVVMNRVNNPKFPNTIEGVLTQPYQFSGYWACNYEWSNVTQSVRDAVDYYFVHPEEFGAWTGMWGDGTWNHFY